MAIEVSLEKLIADMIAQETALIKELTDALEPEQTLCVHKISTVEQYPGYFRTGSRAHILEPDDTCRSKFKMAQYRLDTDSDQPT